MPTVESLRQDVFDDPLHMIQAAAGLLEVLEIDTDPAKDPEQFLVDLHHNDPRYVDRFGNRRDQVISRQDVTEKAHSITDDDEVEAIFAAADALGIRGIDSYPIDEGRSSLMVVTGGVLDAIRTRTRFASDSFIGRYEIALVGSDRLVTKAENEQLIREGKIPYAHTTEKDLARLVEDEFYDEFYKNANRIFVYEPPTTNPDNLDVIGDILRDETIDKDANLTIVTTELYVPFTTADAGAANAMLGNKFDIQVIAGVSDPAKVANRKVDTYRTEVMKTLASAARWNRELTRRKLR